MSITALVIGMIVLLIRRFADKQFSPFWKYVMWGLVLIALLLPWRPQSSFAVMAPVEKVEEISFREQYNQEQGGYEIVLPEESAGESVSHGQPDHWIEAESKVFSLFIKALLFDFLFPCLWLCGAVIIGLFTVFSGLQLGKKIKRSTRVYETERYEKLLQRCSYKLGIKRRIRITLQNHVKTPALFGIFRPQIILPEYVETLSDDHLEYESLY